MICQAVLCRIARALHWEIASYATVPINPDPRRMRDLRAGTLVGTDSFGNEYFENNDHIYGECNVCVDRYFSK